MNGLSFRVEDSGFMV